MATAIVRGAELAVVRAELALAGASAVTTVDGYQARSQNICAILRTDVCPQKSFPMVCGTIHRFWHAYAPEQG